MDNNPFGQTKDSHNTVQLLYALNSIATTLQQSIESEQHIYTAFQREVVALGLRGGISELDETGRALIFKTVAFTNPIRKMLSRFEKKANLKAEGYKIRVDQVDVYHKVVTDGQSVFVPDTSKVSAQVVPHKLRGLIGPILSFLGSPPGIFSPLIYEGQVKGMLNIVGPNLTDADLPALQVFANQIAVALENARLVSKLQLANEALEIAYQKTLEGWVKALDLRDNETEGHTLRVSEATVKLAEFIGVAETHHPYIRTGAMLHDIGKMAIPDSILLKPGPLTDSEWQIMRKHPQTAYNWLKSIDYLKPALDIPLYHHEHWNGNGYPRGLAGEQIPLFARIFTVLDVWDAMLSDRPYRKALSKQQVLKHLRLESGKLFDPQVIEAFMDMIARNPENLTGPNIAP